MRMTERWVKESDDGIRITHEDGEREVVKHSSKSKKSTAKEMSPIYGCDDGNFVVVGEQKKKRK